MSGTALQLSEFSTREAASRAAATFAAQTLQQEVSRAGRASLMVSGGATPARLFELLASEPIDWPRVTVGLVDERWVEPSHPDSNERLVRTHLLKGPAASAGFVPMFNFDHTPPAAQPDRNAAYAPHCDPLGLALLGMGTDGHTASWFPGDAHMRDLVSSEQARCVAAVSVPEATVPQRMTLTGGAVLRARCAMLLVFGDEKRSLLLASHTMSPANCPVRFAIDGLGERLSIYWAP
jgi:6-phosphogluconolactonase